MKTHVNFQNKFLLKMGKFNKKLGKKSKALQLQIVPKEQETEILLEEVRKSDDIIAKKVK